MKNEHVGGTEAGEAGGEQAATILQMMQSLQVSALLKAAVDLDVFSQLEQGPRTLEQVATGIGCPERGVRILLDGLVVVGLLAREEDRYGLRPLAARHLVPGQPMYVGDAARILCHPMMWEGLGGLAEAVRRGGSVLDRHAETPGHSFWEVFAENSSALAGPAAGVLAALLREWMAARPSVRVLDVAAGSGLLGFQLVRQYPQVELCALDWPNVLVETRRWAGRLGVDPQRVRYLEGSLFELDFGGPYDLILLGQIYHHFDRERCQALSRKVAGALAPGGRAVIHEMMEDAELRNPAGTLFSVTMLIWTRQGEAYGADDYRAWLTEAGLQAPTLHASAGMPSTFIMADKPR